MDHAKLLSWIMIALFPNELERKRVEKVLKKHGTGDYYREARVGLAVLKLAGTQLERIEYYIGQADVDYRDVLAMAEYPGQMRQPYSLKEEDPDRYAQIMEEDRKQYEEWIEMIIKGEGKRENGEGTPET
jgi:hypothetical protein